MTTTALRLRIARRPASSSNAAAPIAAGRTQACSYHADVLAATGSITVFGFAGVGALGVIAVGVLVAVGDVAAVVEVVDVPGVVDAVGDEAVGEVVAGGVIVDVAGVPLLVGGVVVPVPDVELVADEDAGVEDDGVVALGGVVDAVVEGVVADGDAPGVFVSAVDALPQMSSLDTLSGFVAGVVDAGVVDGVFDAADGVVVLVEGVVGGVVAEIGVAGFEADFDS